LVEEEQVDLVDEDDRAIGVAKLDSCLQKGLLHRAVAIVVKRRNGAIILQRRSRRDAWHPGLWTVSCAGHVRSGESYEAAANRELSEELGVKGDLELLGRFQIPPISSDGLIEREWVALFMTITDATLNIDPVELESAVEVPESDLNRILVEWQVTPDAKLILREYLNRK
jgi:isopentenyl-diphosphate delta-isomerase type 1